MLTRCRNRVGDLLLMIGLMAMFTNVPAEVIVRVTELPGTPGGVQVNSTGSINLSTLTPFTLDRTATFTAITGTGFLNLGSNAIASGSTPDQVDRYLMDHVDVVFADCSCQELTREHSGDFFIIGVDRNNARTSLSLPTGYVSGAPIDSAATYVGRSFETFGLRPGTYEFDQVTLIIGAEPPAPGEEIILETGFEGDEKQP